MYHRMQAPSSSGHHCMSPWLDQIVETVCDESCDPQQYVAMGGPLLSSSTSTTAGVSYRLPPVDGNYFAKQHDGFLDSLLQEQVGSSSSSAVDVSSDANCSTSGTSTHSNNSWTFLSSPTSSTTSCSSETSATPHHTSHNNNTSSRKRRRPVRLRRKVSPLRPNHVISTASTSGTASAASRGLETIRLEELSESNPPHYYLHPHCRIQKDKGKGDPIGSKICGKTAEVTLSKLRAKMLLLTEHCVAPSASMKRRAATVSKWTDSFCETRSLLTLKMGFLSMTYGILLRWDVARHRKITLVVLRKNCHESFYKLIVPASSLSAWFPPRTPPPPPPVETRVTILYAVGFPPQSRWTVKMTLGNETEHVVLSPGKDDPNTDHNDDGSTTTSTMLVPRFNAMITGTGDELVLCLLEHTKRHHSKILRCTLRVPTASLSSSSSSSLQPNQLRVPCPDGGYLQLEAIARHWDPTLVRGTFPNRTYSGETDGPPLLLAEDEKHDAGNGWDWLLCMVC